MKRKVFLGTTAFLFIVMLLSFLFSASSGNGNGLSADCIKAGQVIGTNGIKLRNMNTGPEVFVPNTAYDMLRLFSDLAKRGGDQTKLSDGLLLKIVHCGDVTTWAQRAQEAAQAVPAAQFSLTGLHQVQIPWQFIGQILLCVLLFVVVIPLLGSRAPSGGKF